MMSCDVQNVVMQLIPVALTEERAAARRASEAAALAARTAAAPSTTAQALAACTGTSAAAPSTATEALATCTTVTTATAPPPPGPTLPSTSTSPALPVGALLFIQGGCPGCQAAGPTEGCQNIVQEKGMLLCLEQCHQHQPCVWAFPRPDSESAVLPSEPSAMQIDQPPSSSAVSTAPVDSDPVPTAPPPLTHGALPARPFVVIPFPPLRVGPLLGEAQDRPTRSRGTLRTVR
jgi:hypothetical protein